MKRVLLAMSCVLVLARFAYADAVKDMLVEIIQGRLEKTVDEDFKKLNYWKDLLTNTAGNQPEITVAKILEDYSTNPAAKDTALNGLDKIAPEAVGPIGLLLSANEALQQSTIGMQEFYKDKRLVEFLDTVIKPAATTQALKKNFDGFKSPALAGLPQAEKQEVEARMRDIYQQRLADIGRKEKAAEAQKLIEQTVSRTLKKIRADAYMKVSVARDYLSAAATPVTIDALRKFINDPASAAALEAKAREEIAKRKSAPAAKPASDTAASTSTAKTADVKEAAAGADSLIGKTLQLEMVAGMVGTNTTVDYGPYLSLYKEAAERLVANSIPGEVFNDVTKRVLQAANTAFNTALANCPAAATADKQACRDGYAKFSDDTGAVRKSLDDKAASIKARLEELSMSKEWTPTEYYAQLTANFNTVFTRIRDAADPAIDIVRNEKAPSFGYEVKRGAPGKPGASPLTLAEIKARYQQFAVAAASCSAVIAESERCANLLREKIKSYDPDFKKHYADYGELYATNGALAEYAGIKFYNFQKEIDGISGAQEMLSVDAGTFVSEGTINNLKRNCALLTKEVESWKAQLDGNEAFVAAYASLPEKVKPFGSVKGVDKITPEFFQTYYDKNLRDFIMGELQGSLVLLSESTKGIDPAEPVRYGTGESKVGELAGTKAFASIPEHEKRLKEFRDKLGALKDMDLDDRAGKLLELTGKAQKDYDDINLKSVDTQKLWNELESARTLAASLGTVMHSTDLPRIYGGADRTMSLKVLQPLANQYAEAIARAYETEKKLVEAFKKYQASPVKPLETKLPQDYRDAMTAIGAKKWDFSQNVWAEYGKLSKINYDLLAAENRRFSPVKSLQIGEKFIDSAEAQIVEFTAADLRDGELVIEGKVYPETVKYLAGLAITIDGGKSKETLPVGESFSFKFKPKEETTYSIRVLSELNTKEKTSPFPAGDKPFSCTYAAKVNKEDIVKMYTQLKAAYEVKSDTAVLAFVDARWNSADGIGIVALRDSIAKAFRLFDEIKMDMSAVNVRRVSAGKFEVSYEVSVVGRLPNTTIKREDRSAVVDEVSFDGGRPRITKTLSGHFWYAK